MSASVTSQLSSCKLLSLILCSNVSHSLGWSRLIPLCAMLWQNMPVSHGAPQSYIMAKQIFQDADVHSIDLDFIRNNAKNVLASSDIGYLRAAQLCGSLFQEVEEMAPGTVSSVFMEFYVDHKELLEVLDKFRVKGKWCLGDLLDGHEYLALFPVAPLSPIELF